MPKHTELIARLRRHAYQRMEMEAAFRLGMGVTTQQEDREDLEAVLNEAADELEKHDAGNQ